MPEVQEVFRMATQKVRPEPGFVERQNRNQRKRMRNRWLGAYALVAAIGILATVVVIRAADETTARRPAGRPTATTSPTIRAIPDRDEVLEPGRYAMSPLGLPDFNATYRITIDVPGGYRGFAQSVVLSTASGSGVSVWSVGSTFGDACRWSGTQSAISSADDLVASLAGQRALRPSTPTDVMVDGFAGTYMELTLPAGADLGRCDKGRFRVWANAEGGARYLNDVGQTDRLWIFEVDGTPLVIDSPIPAGASTQDRAEADQMVRSIRIAPR
jgi:hypothetical protein